MQHSMRRTGSGMSKCVPAISSRVRVARVLHPVPEALLPSMRRAGSASRAATASSSEPPGTILSRHLGHLVLDALELLEAPRIGLFEVDRGAEEVARPQGVPLAPDGVLVPPAGDEVRVEPPAEGRERVAGLAACRCRSPRRPSTSERAARPRRSRRRLLARPAAQLRRDHGELPFRGDVAAGGLLGQRLTVGVERRRDRGEAGVDVRPGLLALGRHQVEHGPDLVQAAGQHRDLGLRDARLVELDVEPEALQERLLGDLLALVGRLGRGGLGEGATVRSARAAYPSGERSLNRWSWPGRPRKVPRPGPRAA